MSDAYLNKLLGSSEKILLVTRRHWFVLLEQILVEIFISAITILLITIILLSGGAANPMAALGYLILVIPLVSLVRDVMVWANHKYIVTNLRVIQVNGIVNKSVIDSSLEKVNDVVLNQSVLGRLFNFGDVEVLTASEMGVNRFTRIGDPVRFKTAMLNAKTSLDQHGQHYTSPEAVVPSPMSDIPAFISRLGDLRDQGLLTEEEFQEKKKKLLDQI